MGCNMSFRFNKKISGLIFVLLVITIFVFQNCSGSGRFTTFDAENSMQSSSISANGFIEVLPSCQPGVLNWQVGNLQCQSQVSLAIQHSRNPNDDKVNLTDNSAIPFQMCWD